MHVLLVYGFYNRRQHSLLQVCPRRTVRHRQPITCIKVKQFNDYWINNSRLNITENMESEFDSEAIDGAVCNDDQDDAHCIHAYEPSICIPRVDFSTTQKQVSDIFERVFGDGSNNIVQGVDMVTRQNENGDSYKRVFVHFADWTSMPKANALIARQALLDGRQIKIMYEPCNYWKCSASRLQRPDWLPR